jgi:hypothetical protein
MRSVQSEDARDLESRDELQQAFLRYLQADDAKREEARTTYLKKLHDFTTRVLGTPSNPWQAVGRYLAGTFWQTRTTNRLQFGGILIVGAMQLRQLALLAATDAARWASPQLEARRLAPTSKRSSSSPSSVQQG